MLHVIRSQQTVGGWPGWRFAAGEVEIGLTPVIGGRLLSLRFRDEELLWAPAEGAGEAFDFTRVTDLAAEKRRLGFGLWGGDKTWIAPQAQWLAAIPPLELDAGPYAAVPDDTGLTMTSVVCRETGLRVVRRVELAADGALTLVETIRNESAAPVTRGLWNVTMTRRPFDVYLPGGGVRPYPEEGTSVAMLSHYVTSTGGWTRIACREPAHFKYGGAAARGVVVALRPRQRDTLALVRWFDHPPGATYAHGSEVEVYNSPSFDYLEIELHAPLITLAPGQSTTQRQVWRVGVLPAGAGPDEAAQTLAR